MTVGRLLLAEGTAFDWIVAGLAMALFGILVVWAVRRANRQRLAFRIVLTGVAVASLLLMAWQPRRLMTPRPVEALLLTPGASSAQVQRLADSLATAPLYTLPGFPPPRLAGRGVTVVPDVGYLVRRHPEIATLHVVGEGLPGYDLAVLRSVAVRAHPAPPQPGIQFVDLPRRAFVGQAMQVQGQVYLEEKRPHMLLLEGPGGVVDSIDVAEPGRSSFSLEAAPRQAGRHGYRLILVGAPGDTVALEPFGVWIRDPAPLRVLVLQGAPRFETRHLKNWLAAEGGRLAIRSTVSRDRYRSEFLNQPERDLSRLTPALLRTFDIVLLDARTLADLSASERSALQTAVAEEGLGLLLSPDLLAAQGGAPGARFFQSFSGRPLDESEGRRVRLAWEGSALNSSIPAEPYAISQAWGVEPLMRDEAGRVVAAMRQQGRGRVGLSLATETYRWVLEGNTALHASYWSYLFSVLARADDAADQWAVRATGPVFRDEPVSFVVHTGQSRPRGFVFSKEAVPDTLYLAQDPDEPTRRHATFWPRTTGWHRVTTAAESDADASFWFYVHPRTAWKALQAAQNTTATKQVASATVSEAMERTGPLSSVPLPLWWFFLSFLVASAGLWLEGKL